MGIDLDARLVESATKVAVSRNEYGDTIYGPTTTTACLYREITGLDKSSLSKANSESVRIDGELWFSADETISLGDIYQHNSEGYLRIEKIIVAKRRLVDNSTQFIKCYVSRQRQLS